MASNTFVKRSHLVSSIEIGRILKAARRYSGHTQVEMARELGVEQSAYSRIESGDQGLTTSQWFRFCEVTNMVPEAVRTGLIEFYSDQEICPQTDFGISHRFKVPSRYQNEAGSSVRAALPFINYAEKVWGERKADSFIETMGLSRDFFTVLNNRVNLNFCLDISRTLIERGDLKKDDVANVASAAVEPQVHGILRYRYDGARNSLGLIGDIVDSARRYECNFNYSILDQGIDRLVLSVAPAPHLEKFSYRDDATLGSFLCDYKKAYFGKFSTLGGRKGVSIEERDCHYHGSRSDKCVYEIRQLV